MKSTQLVLLLACVTVTTAAQNLPSFKVLRYEENYSTLNKDSVPNFYGRLKYCQLFREKVYLSAGGSIRYQFIKVENEDWGETPESTDGYLQARHLLHFDMHIGKRFRTFVDFQSSLSLGKRDVSPLDENPLEIHQLFLDYNLIMTPVSCVTLRFGRQEILYGSQRLISVRNGPNNRQAFDGIKFMYAAKNTNLDLFYDQFVLARFNSFNDTSGESIKIWGIYGVRHNVPFFRNLDFYYLGLHKALAVYDDGPGREVRHSIGTRLWKLSGKLKFDVECLYQFGEVGNQTIRAWTTSFNAIYSFHSKLNPRVGLKTEIVTGDRHYDDQQINTFNSLFPSGAYFGLAALFGPSNLIDFHPTFSFSLSKKIDLTIDYDIFWRHKRNDGIYTNNMQLIYSGRDNDHLYIGNQYSTKMEFEPCRFLSLSAEIKWFVTGSYLKTAGEGKNILLGLVSTLLTF